MNGTIYDLIMSTGEKFTRGKLRAELMSHARGKTLEIGAGTGLNFAFIPKSVEYTGIEPDESMRKSALKKEKKFHFHVENGDAQSLKYSDEMFDTVAATLVFCSIPDPDMALKEVYRVLKPGGQFLLLEHVKRNTPVAGWLQDHLTPMWKHMAGNCHLNRDPEAEILRLGFSIEEKKILWNGFGKMWVLRK